MTAAEHMAQIKRMTPEDVDRIERQMLIDMARRYGVLQDREALAMREGKAAAIRMAKANAKEGAA